MSMQLQVTARIQNLRACLECQNSSRKFSALVCRQRQTLVMKRKTVSWK